MRLAVVRANVICALDVSVEAVGRRAVLYDRARGPSQSWEWSGNDRMSIAGPDGMGGDRDGTKLMVFEPLVWIERLSALVPRPQRSLVTHHGAFAPAVSYRDRVVPAPAEEEGERPAFRSRQRRRCAAVGEQREMKPHGRRRSTWAELMRRCFGVDVLICPHCETWRRLLTFLTNPRSVTRVLSHLALPTE